MSLRASVLAVLMALGLAAGAAAPARAGLLTLETPANSDVLGLPVRSSVTFAHDADAGVLTITLSNLQKATNPEQILTGLLWSVEGTAPTGTSVQAASTAVGSALYTNASTSSTDFDLRTRWGYRTTPGTIEPTIADEPGSFAFQFGLSAAGQDGLFGHSIAGNNPLQGSDYGIIGPASNLANPPLRNFVPLVMSTSVDGPSSAVFTISNWYLPTSAINGATFLYGSGAQGRILVVPDLPVVPEPSSIAGLGIGLATVLAAAYRRRRAGSTA